MTLIVAWLKHPCAFVFAAFSTSAFPERALLTGIVVQARIRRHGSNQPGKGSPFRALGQTSSGVVVRERRHLRCRRTRASVVCRLPFHSSSNRQNSRPVSVDEVTEGARARAAALVQAFVPTPATAKDMRCIEERQLRHKAGETVSVSPPCRHGFPQAFAFDPCGHKISSGLFRLSCPLLVKAIDELEDEGGIGEVNARLETDGDLREDFMAVNLAHAQLRRRLLTADKMHRVEQSMGREAAERFADSGITGVTPGKVRDAKCLHAHVADALMRGRGANAIGRQTLELLEARGVQTDGGDRCREQCDYRKEETVDGWRYMPQKNKQRLLLRKVRRKSAKPPSPRTAPKEVTTADKDVAVNAEHFEAGKGY